jgi:hypothetical protein
MYQSRPDYFGSRRQILIIEVDEFMHRWYSQECSSSEPLTYLRHGGIPVIIIRYNPDAYDKGKKNATQEERLQVLLRRWITFRDEWQSDAKQQSVTAMHVHTYGHRFEESIQGTIEGKCHLISEILQTV